VGNWPIDILTKTPVAFNYIEIWPPKTRYTDVAEIVRNARRLSGQKPVVVALYLHAINPINNLLADAMIFSAGGTRIELGENGRLLSDPYFPKHEAMDTSLSEHLRRQVELIIRYEEWISPLIEESSFIPVQGPQGIEYFFRRTAKGYSLSQVNLGSSQPLHWNEEHPQPEIRREFALELQLDEPIERVWLVSPDHASLSPVPLEFKSISNKIIVKVPSLEIWNVFFFETKKVKL
jgi:dextranase